VLLSIPGVSYSSSEPGQSRYSIRGVSTAASSPTVGIYLNDISLITVGTNFAGAACHFEIARWAAHFRSRHAQHLKHPHSFDPSTTRVRLKPTGPKAS